MTRSPGSYRRHLGRELRHAREAANFTQKQAAALLKCEQGKIAKMEADLVEIDVQELDRLMQAYGLPEAKQAQLRDARLNSDIPRARARLPKPSRAFQKLVDLEGEASEILSWHSERIPGPLQSEAYMLKQFRVDRPGDREYVTQLERERTARIGLFKTDPAPCYQVVLSVSSLLRIPGGWNPELALDQIQHLVRLVETYSQLDLRLLTVDAKIAAAVSDFTVLRFRESTPDYIQASDFAYVEYPGGGDTTKEIKPFLEEWAELRKEAVSRDETFELLRTWADEMNKQLVSKPSGEQGGSTP